MNQFEQWITRQRRRLSLGVFLTAFTDAMALFLLVLGSSVLLVKLARPGLWPGVLCLAALVLPLSAWAWWTSRQRSFSRSQAIALLDSKTGVNGLLMTLCETTGPESSRPQSNSPQSNGHMTDVTGWSEHLAAQNPDWRTGLPRLRPVRAARGCGCRSCSSSAAAACRSARPGPKACGPTSSARKRLSRWRRRCRCSGKTKCSNKRNRKTSSKRSTSWRRKRKARRSRTNRGRSSIRSAKRCACGRKNR